MFGSGFGINSKGGSSSGGGGGIFLQENTVAYGSLLNTMTSSINLVYNPTAGLFYIGFDNNRYLSLDAVNQKYALGDIGGSSGGAYLQVDDSVAELSIKGLNSGTYVGNMLQINGESEIYGFGDLESQFGGAQFLTQANIGNTFSAKISDGSGSYFTVDTNRNAYGIGDLDFANNGTSLIVDDSAKIVQVSTNNATRYFGDMSVNYGLDTISIGIGYLSGSVPAFTFGTKYHTHKEDFCIYSENTSSTALAVEPISAQTFYYTFGDVDSLYNRTKMLITDSALNRFQFSGVSNSGSFGNMLDFRGYEYQYSLGDIQSINSGCTFDLASTDTTTQAKILDSTSSYFSIDSSSFVFGFGDLGSIHNGNCLVINDSIITFGNIDQSGSSVHNGTYIEVNSVLKCISVINAISTPTMQVYNGGGSVTISDGVRGLYYDPSSVVSSATITLPANPVDGQEVLILFGGTITSGIVVDFLTVSPNSGQSIVGIVNNRGKAEFPISYKYRVIHNQWFVI